MRGWTFPFSFCLAIAALAFIGCSRPAAASGPRYAAASALPGPPKYTFAVHPLYNPTRLLEAYQPLIDYLNRRIDGARLTLEASRDYGAFERKYRQRKPDFLLANPWHTLDAIRRGYHVIAMAGLPSEGRGIIFVRKDSGIERPEDLRGKTISYPAPTGFAACIMPQYFLHRHGLDVDSLARNKYVGSQESAIMNVYLGLAEAGAAVPPSWQAFRADHPRRAAKLKLAWETEPLVNNSVMARDDLPRELVDRIASLLADLSGAGDGAAILAGIRTARFVPANDRSYDVVRPYIAGFEKEVRKVE